MRPPEEPPSHRSRMMARGWGAFTRFSPLLAILVVQTSLSVGLIWSNTAFTDEALYLRTGHLEIAHWLHGTPIPAFPTYFSGAPILYPPIGALADSVGGLAAARILSLFFMLCATALLWSAASRLYGRLEAFFAVAIFSVLGPTLRLDAFATFDAMSLCLLALAVFCAIRAAHTPRTSGWLVAAAFSLSMANATKYASAIFDPAVMALLFLLAMRTGTWKQALSRSCVMMAYALGILVFLLALSGGEYLTGVEQTTLARLSGRDSTSEIMLQSWHLTAIVLVLGLAAILVSLARRRFTTQSLVLVVLTGCALLVPLEQARIHTLTSLNKHVDFGAWFASIAAGYVVGWLIGLLRVRSLRWVAATACAGAMIVPAWMGLAQARAIFETWPDSAAMVATLRYVLPRTSGPILFDNNRALPQYYLPVEGDQWYRWSNNSSLRLLDGKSVSVSVGHEVMPSLYAARVRGGYFSVVVLNFSSAARLDRYVLPALRENKHYHLRALVPYGSRASQVWVYEPQTHFYGKMLGPREHASASALVTLLTPVARLRPILGVVQSAVAASGMAVIFLVILIRFGWRREKACDEI